MKHCAAAPPPQQRVPAEFLRPPEGKLPAARSERVAAVDCKTPSCAALAERDFAAAAGRAAEMAKRKAKAETAEASAAAAATARPRR